MQEVFDKIIEKLEEIKSLTPNLVEYQEADDIENRCSEIIDMVTEYNNGWIPCSSGVIPRANGWYLVTNELGVVQEQRWSANHWEKLRDNAVIAWRELPEPYQQKGDKYGNEK